MTDDHTGVKAVRLCGAFVFTLLLALLLSVRFDFYYDLNDDTMIKDILSGAYTGTPDGHCIQMLYPLGWCLALFYRAIPNVSWYGLFLCLCQFGVIFLVTARLLMIMKSRWTRIMALAAESAFLLGLFLRELVIIQYSVTAGMCMAGAVFLFLTAPGACRPSVFLRKNLLPLFLVVLAFMIRTEVCIMLMPFLLIAGLSGWLDEDKIFTGANFKKYIMLVVTAALCMTAVYSLDMLAYKGSEWSSFRNFFDARTKLYDFYGLPPYDSHRDFYESIGLSKESYTLLENYNFALDDSIDTWRLEAIVRYQEQLAKASGSGGTGLKNTFGFISKNSIGEAVWLYKNQVLADFGIIRAQGGNFSPRAACSIAVAAAYLVYFLVCVVPAQGKQRYVSLFRIIALWSARSVLWLYLYMVDRLPERITMPLLMMELVVTAGFGICGIVARKKFIPFYVLYIAALLVTFSGSLSSVEHEYAIRATADERWNSLMDYCRKNGNNYYIIDVYSSTSYHGAPYSEKMFSKKGIYVDNSYKNFDICGGWAAKSPLTRQKLARSGLKDIQRSLAGRKAYFIAGADKENGWLVQYYKMRGMAVEPECVDEIRTPSAEPASAFYVYELKRG